MSLAALPDSIRSRILSHLLQPKAPTDGEQQQQQILDSRAGIESRLRGKSITHGPLVLDGWVTPDAVKVGASKASGYSTRHSRDAQ